MVMVSSLPVRSSGGKESGGRTGCVGCIMGSSGSFLAFWSVMAISFGGQLLCAGNGKSFLKQV
jgi:hypothetical protein